jgi:hypothetical protein
LGATSPRPHARLGLGMFRLALLFSCLLSVNCSVLTTVLSTDLGDASTEESDAELPGDVADAAGNSADSGPACPPEYTETAGTCHRVGTETLNWLLAESACELDGSGAHLVIVSNEQERLALPENVWIGLYEFDFNGNFRTVTNVDPPHLIWDTNEPVPGPGYCVYSLSQGFHDDACTNLRQYVCEFDGVPASTPYLP